MRKEERAWNKKRKFMKMSGYQLNVPDVTVNAGYAPAE
jgi:hypothetical protein